MPASAASAPAAQPAGTQSAVFGRVLFHDHFGKASRAWTFHNRDGAIRGGRLWIDGDYQPGAAGRDGWALTHVGATHWRDYAFSVTYNSANVNGGPAEVHMASLYFRVASAGSTGRDTAYRLDLWDPGQPDPRGSGDVIPNGLLQLTRYVDGEGTPLKEVTNSNTRVGTNRVTVVATGGKILVRANGRVVLRFVDPAPIRFGGVGMGQIWETNGWFDHVLVRKHR